MSEDIRNKIISLISEYYKSKEKKFIPGKTRIRYSGDVIDEKELIGVVNSVLDGWWGLGKYEREFRKNFSEFYGVKHTIVTNSGSSANLIAVSSLLSKEFNRKLNKGDEVITPAVTFPTTLNPIIQNGLKPVFLDVESDTYNINADKLEEAISDKTRLIMLPHTIGNPNEMDKIMKFANDHNLIVIEDNCDAQGSKYDNKLTGTFGIMSTFSFYPAHQMTMGEGGAVITNDNNLNKILRSIRDWGRACYCDTDEKNPTGACGKRFDFKVSGVPYDHKYMYSHIGYNLKPLDLQTAMGTEQLKKLPDFIEARKRNFKIFYEEFKKYDDYFILPRWHKKSDPCWFCFPLTIKDNSKIKRRDIITFLEKNNIETRLMFAGNILEQPGYLDIDKRIVGKLDNSDKIMHDAFFLGVYPGLTEEMIKYVLEKIKEFMSKV